MDQYFTPTNASNPRPKGTATDLHRYKGSHDWTYRQWAWQFLRRNPRFIEACKSVQPDDVARQEAIAAEFKLKSFRDYRLGFRDKQAPSPRFLPADVSFWQFRGTAKVYKPRLSLREGEVLVRFDLSQAALDRGALDAQLRKTSEILKSELDGYLAAKNLKPPKGHKPRKQGFLKLLRLLDLLDADGRDASDLLRATALRALFPTRCKGLSDSEVRRSVGHHIERARAFSENDYLYVAASPDRKKPKKRKDPTI